MEDNVVNFQDSPPPAFATVPISSGAPARNERVNGQHKNRLDAVRAQRRGIKRAVDLIECNFASGLSRGEMARAAGLSVSYFSELFARCVGVSPHRYLVGCRLRHAKKLLSAQENVLSLVDVATEAGFADQAHLSRHFRCAYGMSPLAYRRATRGECESVGPKQTENRILARRKDIRPNKKYKRSIQRALVYVILPDKSGE